MKIRNKKKFLVIGSSLLSIATITTTATIASITPSLNSNNEQLPKTNTKQQNNGVVILDGKYYQDLHKATNAYIQQNAIIDDDFYLGDLADAIFFGSDFQEVNKFKLRKYDISRVKQAYPRVTGGFTDKYDEAKKSMFDTPRNYYLDFNGNKFSTYQQALDSIHSRIETIPISYYEVYDNAKKAIVKINPLNKQDQLELKKIAINNLKINDQNNSSPFELKKFSNVSSSQKYVDTSKLVSAKNEIELLKQKIINELIELLKQKIINELVNRARFKVDIIPKVTNERYTAYHGSYNISYSKNSTKQEIIDKNTLINDIDYFESRVKLEEKFNIDVKHSLSMFVNWAYNATAKDSQKAILGYENLKFEYNGGEPNWFHGADLGLLGKKCISFFDGKISQVYFGANIEFDSFDITNKTGIKKEIIDALTKDNSPAQWKVIFEADKSIENELEDFLDKYFQKLEQQANSFKSVFKNQLNYANLTKYNDNQASFSSDISTKIDNLIVNGLNNNQEFKDLLSTLENKIPKLFNLTDNDGFYAITYNNQYLFKVNLDNIGFNYNSTNPQDDIKNKLKLIIKNEQALENGLINISNIVDYNPTTAELSLNKQTLDSFNNNNFNNYLVKLLNNHAIDSNSIYSKFFDQNIINDTDQLNQLLNGALLLFGSDDKALLSNSYGIAQAVHYYNKQLEFKKSDLKNDLQAWKEVQQKAIQHPNDIITLWQSDGLAQKVYYGEYLGNTTSFNESLSNEANLKVYLHDEKIKYAIKNVINLKPTEIIIIKDRLGNVINFALYDRDGDGNLDDVSDDYFNDEQTAEINAWNNYHIDHSTEYVFYVEDNKNLTLLKSDVSRLWNLELKLLDGTLENRTFTTYDNVFNYVKNYLSKNVSYVNYSK